MRYTLPTVAAFVATSLSGAQPDCPRWTPSGPYPGLNYHVSALTAWDRDGAGPASPLLVAAGAFTHAGSVEARNIAVWDGAVWSALPGGAAFESLLWGTSFSLAQYRSDLVVGSGNHSIPTGEPVRTILRFDGVEWLPLSEQDDPQGAFLSLVVDGDDLFGAGEFRYPYATLSTHSNQVVHFDGSEWRQLPLGHDGDGVIRPSHPIVMYRGDLIAAATIERPGTAPPEYGLARWDGETWTLLPETTSPRFSEIRAIAADEDNLYVGGAFADAMSFSQHAVSKWDGASWTTLGSSNGAWGSSLMVSLDVLDGAVYVSGALRGEDGDSMLFRWDGEEWAAASGIEFGLALATVVYDGRLVIGGYFPAGYTPASFGNIAAWDSTGWSALGEGVREYITAFAAYDGSLIAAGAFEATGTEIAHLARWDGARWTPYVAQTDGLPNAMTVWDGGLVVLGAFGGSPARYAARWDGAQWSALDDGFALEDPDFLAYPHTMTVWNGELYASRQLYSQTTGLAPEPPLPGLMRWTGERWMAAAPPMTETSRPILDMLAYGGRLIAMTYDDVFTWDGTRWASIISEPASPSSLSGYFVDLHVHDGALWVAGAIDAIPYASVAKWDGVSWQTLPPTPSIHTDNLLGSYNGMLRYGDTLWDGHAWRPLPVGFDPPHIAFNTSHTHEGELFLTGTFVLVGGQPSAYLARYRNALGDANNDHATNFLDLVLVLGNYARAGEPGSIPGDCNNDGVVDMRDLNDVLSAFGQACPPPM
ncbi:MAG: hypothetical protein AB7R63_05835 [Phycisphaerales bacterium]